MEESESPTLVMVLALELVDRESVGPYESGGVDGWEALPLDVPVVVTEGLEEDLD